MFRTYEARDVVEDFAVVSNFWDVQNLLNLKGKKCFIFGSLSDGNSESKISDLKKLGSNYIYVLDLNDLKFITNPNNLVDNLITVQWLQQQNVSVSVTFRNQNRYVVTSGPIPAGEKNWDKIKNNVHFVNYKEHWLKSYDGRFGYCMTLDNRTDYYSYGITISSDLPVMLNVDASGVSETTIRVPASDGTIPE